MENTTKFFLVAILVIVFVIGSTLPSALALGSSSNGYTPRIGIDPTATFQNTIDYDTEILTIEYYLGEREEECVVAGHISEERYYYLEWSGITTSHHYTTDWHVPDNLTLAEHPVIIDLGVTRLNFVESLVMEEIPCEGVFEIPLGEISKSHDWKLKLYFWDMVVAPLPPNEIVWIDEHTMPLGTMRDFQPIAKTVIEYNEFPTHDTRRGLDNEIFEEPTFEWEQVGTKAVITMIPTPLASVEATTMPTVPDPVTDLSVIRDDVGDYILSWTTPNLNGSELEKFKVYYREIGTEKWTKYFTRNADATEYVFRDFGHLDNLEFKMKVKNGMGSSENSNFTMIPQ